MNDQNKAIIKRYIAAETDRKKLNHILRSFNWLLKDYDARDIKQPDDLNDCYYEKLASYSIIESENLYIDKTLFVKHIYDKYIKTWQFIDHNEYIDLLESFKFPIGGGYAPENVRDLGRYLVMAVNNGTYRAMGFYSQKINDWSNDDNFSRGVLCALISYDSALRIRENVIPKIIDLCQRTGDNLFAELTELDKLPFESTHLVDYLQDIHNDIDSSSCTAQVKSLLKQLVDKCQ